MNIKIIGVSLGLLLMVPIANADDVTITINGKVVAQPCTVSTPNAVVDLGDLYTFDLVTARTTSAWTPTTLSLTSCPEGTSQVTATFSGTADSSGQYYANQGTAGNIALQLQDTNGTNLSNGTAEIVPVNTTSLSANFTLQVRAITPNGNASQGTILSVINVTYTYS